MLKGEQARKELLLLLTFSFFHIPFSFLHSNHVKLFKGNDCFVILLWIFIFYLHRLSTLTVIPAAFCFFKLSSVQEMRKFLSVYLYPVRRFFSVNHVNLHVFYLCFIAALRL